MRWSLDADIYRYGLTVFKLLLTFRNVDILKFGVTDGFADFLLEVDGSIVLAINSFEVVKTLMCICHAKGMNFLQRGVQKSD